MNNFSDWTREELLKGLSEDSYDWETPRILAALCRLEALEREACAKIARDAADQKGLADWSRFVAENIEAAIRARGKE